MAQSCRCSLPLRGLLPGGLACGTVVAVEHWGLLCPAVAAGASAAGAWCAAVGLPQLGWRRRPTPGWDPGRLLLIPDPGAGWPQVVASLIDGCELVLLRPPGRPSAQRCAPGSPPPCGAAARCWWWRAAGTAPRPGCSWSARNGRGSGPATGGCARPAGAGGGGRPGRGGAVADTVAVAAGTGRLRWAPWTRSPLPGRTRGTPDDGRPGTCPSGCWSSGARARPAVGQPGRRNGEAAPGSGAVRDTGPGCRNSGRWCPWWKDSARGWRCLRPGACAIGARGPARYFGGEGALAAKIIEAGRRTAASPARWASPTAFSPPHLAAEHAQRPRDSPAGATGRGHEGASRPYPGVPGPAPGQRAGQPGSDGPCSPAGHQDAGRVRPLLSQPRVANRFGTPGVVAHRLARGLGR